MTSVIKSDSELTTNPDSIDSNPTEEPRVSIDCTSNEDKPRVSQIELNSIPSPPSDVDSTVVFDGGSVNDAEGRVSESNYESDADDKNEDLGFVVSSSGGGKEVYSSLLSDFEDFVANEKREASAATSRARSFGFEIGDMVWGKVKSHPWWPGHIFNEAFASSSVRRTRREGHVLVAFFGDSSYGWFDPAELIPFDPHFAEKSQQLNSRTFVKAVEEAVDEASRRCGLGLVCKCRNKYNFRPTNAQGYLAVDVPDYEAGGVYSGSQIMKARDDFSPAKVLGFINDLAQVVQFRDTSSIEFIKNKATVFALRKATFEEFDETYAEAFGTQPTRPSSNAAKASGQPPKAPTRAPLSGPLVIAEALGDRKSSKKSPKLKDNVKKDKYLFKRRDEPSDSKAFQIGQKQDDSFAPASYMEGSPLVAAGDYGLQKRMSAPKHEQTELISSEAAGPRESEQKQPSPEHPSGNFGASATYVVRGQGILQSVDNQMVLDVGGGPSTGGSGLPGKEDNLFSVDSVLQSSQHEGEAGTAHGLNESTKSFKSNESSHPNEMSISAGSDGERLDNVGDGTPDSHLSVSKNSSVIGTADGVIKKTKVSKRSIGDLNSENSEMGEKKKKKKKVSVASPDHPVKRTASGKAIMKNLAGKLKQQSLGSGHLDLPELLHDLHDLALDASNSGRQNHRSLARRFFLRFRSLIYQKSLVASPSSGTESVEIRTSKSMSSVGALDDSAGENAVPSKTVVKPLGRPDDPTRGGKKRLSSDRQEEIAAKKLKKINQLKSMASDKKAGQKPLDAQGEVKEPVGAPTPKYTQREAKEPVAASAPKLVKPSAKKMAPTKTVEPTMLVMKFPPQTSLPSGAELKAKFARFGSIDQSAIRVFWKSSTCRVVFRYKSDAQAAYRYAMGNKSLFGNLEVRYMLREVGAGADAPDSDSTRGGDTYVEVPRVKDTLIERPTPPLAPIPLPTSSMQPPKSILKKPNGDEASVQGSGNNGRGTSRVKFMLAGEETSTSSKPIEQTMSGYRNNNNNNNNSNNNSTATSIGVGGAATSVASEYNSKNFQKFVPPPSSLPPLLPSPPPQFAKAPHPLNNTNCQNPNAAATSSTHTSTSSSGRQNVDISHEMLSLLTKCNDVVSGVKGLLGYVPYHPL